MSGPYDDIIYLPRPISKKHYPMSRHDRAAQFSPFAALTGHDAAIDETARITDIRSEPDEQLKAMLDERLRLLREHINCEPLVNIIYFVPDLRKHGGEYVRHSGFLRRIDLVERSLLFRDGLKVAIDDLYDIGSELFSHLTNQ